MIKERIKPQTEHYQSECQDPNDYDWAPFERDRVLADGNKELAWQKYCGFLDFSIEEYHAIQNLLLKEEIGIEMQSGLGLGVMRDRRPESVEEFRRLTPLTRYSDYLDLFEIRRTLKLGEKPLFWAESEGKRGEQKKIPFNLSATRSLVDDVITALILSAARFKGDVELAPLAKMLVSLRVSAVSQAINVGLSQRLACHSLTAPTGSLPTVSFQNLAPGIEKSLRNGVDFIFSVPETIACLGEYSGFATLKLRLSALNPSLVHRLTRAWLSSHVLGRPGLAKDIWQVKGLVCCGADCSSYTERIEKIWGVRPLEAYFAPETGFMAVQNWNKKGLTFIPYRNFYEFIPAPEIEKEAADSAYQPATVLMDEVQPGEVYELVVTNFHGGPFLRYRIGDYLKVIAMEDTQTGVKLPQFTMWPRSEWKRAFTD